MIIAEALKWGIAQLKKTGSSLSDKGAHHSVTDSPALDAEVLLTHAVSPSPVLLDILSLRERNEVRGRAWLYGYPEQKLTSAQLKIFKQFITRRINHEPVAYIIGHKEFYGLDFLVNRNVLIPRPETEILVDEALKEMTRYKLRATRYTVVDIGTGSGAIVVAIAVEVARSLPQARPVAWPRGDAITCFATDISRAALRVAKQNAKQHGVEEKIKFFHGNLLKPFLPPTYYILPTHLLITANLPYLPTREWRGAMPEVRNFEPRGALDGGKTGLDYYRKLFEQLKKIHNPSQPPLILRGGDGSKGIPPLRVRGGEGELRVSVICEIDPHQSDDIKILARTFFPRASVKIVKDLARLDRVAIIKI